MKFQVTATDGLARRGVLTLAHGTVQTPAFMPVGTYGTVKAMSPAELEGLDAQVVLGNTFHLWLRPGLEVIEAHGDLHRRYELSAIPMTLIADADGVVQRAFVGAFTATDLWAAVAELRAPGTTPEPTLGQVDQ